jgi:hypothetical protein
MGQGLQAITRFPRNRGDCMKERRKYVRVISDVSLRYKEDESRPDSHSKAKDVGGGGIRFVSNVKLTTGTHLKLEIDVPGSRRTVDARARIIWTRKLDESAWEVATEFTEIDQRDRDKIMKHVFFSQKR